MVRGNRQPVTKTVTAHLLRISLAYGLSAALMGVESRADDGRENRPTTDYALPYDVKKPDWTQKLPKALTEVSGLGLSRDGKSGWTVNDERGELFPYSAEQGFVNRPRHFADRGDYESLEIVGNEIVVARSDGTLYRVAGDRVTTVESVFEHACNLEGMGLDRTRSRLLLACKDRAGKGKKYRHMAGVYAVSLPDFEQSEAPVLTIAHRDLKKFIERAKVSGLQGRDAKQFRPSAIAVSPDDAYIYILSTVGRMLVVVDRSHAIVAVDYLPRKVHRQPEGLAFDSEGAMYITNEGRSGRGTLHRFDPKL